MAFDRWFRISLAALVLAFGAAFARAQDDPDDAGDDSAEPYAWQGVLQYDWTAQAHASATSGLSFNSTYSFGDSGSSLGVGVSSTSQKVEGVRVGDGSLSLSGVWGLGDWTPNVSLSTGHAAGGLNTRSVDLGLDWVFQDPFSVTLTGGYGTQRHVAPTAVLLSLPANALTNVEGELFSHSESLGLSFGWQALDKLGFSAGYTRSWDVTDKVENRAHNAEKQLNQRGWTNTLALGGQWTLGNHWSLGFSGNGGKQYSPGLGFYNTRTGVTSTTQAPSKTDFYGAGASLSYSFNL